MISNLNDLLLTILYSLESKHNTSAHKSDILSNASLYFRISILSVTL